MTLYRFRATDSADGYINSSGASWTDAQNGSGTLSVDDTGNEISISMGSAPSANISQAFGAWDTSSIGDSETCQWCAVKVSPPAGWTNTPTLKFARYDWSSTLATSDWRTVAQLQALDLIAEGGGSNVGSLIQTMIARGSGGDSSALDSAINKTGTTKWVGWMEEAEAGAFDTSRTAPINGSEAATAYNQVELILATDGGVAPYPVATSDVVRTSGSSIDVDVPAIAPGQLALLWVYGRDVVADDFTTPTNWTLVETDVTDGTHGRGSLFKRKNSTGSTIAAATVTVSYAGSEAIVGSAVVLDRVDDIGATVTKTDNNGSTHTIPDLTTTEDNSLVLAFLGGNNDPQLQYRNTTRYPLVQGSNASTDLGLDVSTAAVVVEQATAGATGTDTLVTATGDTYRSVVVVVEAIRALPSVTGTLDATLADITAEIATSLSTPVGDGDTNTDVGAGFGTDPFGEPVYTDIAEYIRAMDFGRGRSSVFQTFDAGTCTLVLDNRDGRFDPGNTAGPYYPDVAVGTPIRVRLQRGNTTSVMWVGNIDRIRLEYPGGGHDAVAVVEASENIGLLVRHVLNNNYAEATSDVRVDDVLDEVGWPSALRTLSTSALTTVPAVDYSAEGTSRPSAWQHINDVALAEQGQAYVDKNGYLVFEGRVDAPNSSSATFGVGVSEYPYQSLTLAYDNDLLINRATALAVTGDWQTANDTTSQGIHGIRERSYDLDTLNGEPSALNLAQWTVLRYGTVRQRVSSITINPDADPDNLWPFVRDVELRDLITVKFATPGAGDDINQVCRVEWLRHSATPGQGNWTLTLGLLPVPDIELEDFFTLDVSELDSTDVLA